MTDVAATVVLFF